MRGTVKSMTTRTRYNRAEIRSCLERDGLQAALAKWPSVVVRPIARVLGLVSPYRRNLDAWKPEWTPLLGTKPDTLLAAELGVCIGTVRAARLKLGIGVRFGVGWDARMRREQIFSTITDAELSESVDLLAAKYGIGRQQFREERARRGVRPKIGSRMSPYSLRRVAAQAIRAAYPHVSDTEIAEVLACSRERVRQFIAETP